MNVNFGILPPLEGVVPKGRKRRVERRRMMTERAKQDIQAWLNGARVVAA
jgi:methylenetetrahydrofolate--tRNA-(uracil-5-)-methyltransferase